MQRFANQLAIVTGGGSGIGEAVVRRLCAEGAAVVVADIDGQAAQRVADSLAAGDRIQPVALDVTDRAAVEALISDAQQRFGRLDILVNCAGIRGVGSVLDVEPELWRRVQAVNTEGTLNTCQFFARAVKKAGTPAAIVNVSSTAGLFGSYNRAPYVSSKFAVVGLTRAMAMEVSEFGIRVNAVAPGMTYTPMTEVMFRDEDGVRQIRSALPIGREGRPEEIAAAILFLASDDASFITGVILPVDGGFTAGKRSSAPPKGR
jgi:meso-butanediol dehydrogenase / (S,S)-butanediol dehydrogenase / diacetyl reductase